MKTFLFTKGPSPKRARNVRVKAYRVKHNDPIYLGHADFHTGASKGAYAEACQVIADAGEATMSPDGYGLKSYGATRVIEL